MSDDRDAFRPLTISGRASLSAIASGRTLLYVVFIFGFVAATALAWCLIAFLPRTTVCVRNDQQADLTISVKMPNGATKEYGKIQPASQTCRAFSATGEGSISISVNGNAFRSLDSYVTSHNDIIYIKVSNNAITVSSDRP